MDPLPKGTRVVSNLPAKTFPYLQPGVIGKVVGSTYYVQQDPPWLYQISLDTPTYDGGRVLYLYADEFFVIPEGASVEQIQALRSLLQR